MWRYVGKKEDKGLILKLFAKWVLLAMMITLNLVATNIRSFLAMNFL